MAPAAMWGALEVPYVDWEVAVCGGRLHFLCIFLFSYITAQFLLQSTKVNECLKMGMIQLNSLLCVSAPFHQENHPPAGWEVQADYQWPLTSPQERKSRKMCWGKKLFWFMPTAGWPHPRPADAHRGRRWNDVVKGSVKEYKCTFVY